MAHPHDALFKAAFSQPEHALELLRTLALHHPRAPNLLPLIEGASATLVPGTLVDPSLAQFHTDVLHEIRSPRGGLFLYTLFEHQSYGDHRMPLRLYLYMGGIWQAFATKHPRGPLPPIVSIVVSHVPDGWSDPTHFHELFDAELLAQVPRLADHLPSFRFTLDDLSHLDDEELERRPLGNFAKLALWLLRDGRRGRLLAAMSRWAPLLRGLPRHALRVALHYISSIGQQSQVIWQEFHETLRRLDPTSEGEVMHVLEEMIAEGHAAGHAAGHTAGRVAVLIKLLTLKFGPLPDAVRERLEQGTLDELELWTERVLFAATLDEVVSPRG